MTVSNYLQRKVPKNRKINKLETSSSRSLFPRSKELQQVSGESGMSNGEMEIDTDFLISVPMQFERFT